jgi:hypothetical protein
VVVEVEQLPSDENLKADRRARVPLHVFHPESNFEVFELFFAGTPTQAWPEGEW